MKTTLSALPFMVLLFILPFPETVALRLACLVAAFLIVVISWRRLAPPPVPCVWPIALWAGVVIASLRFAVDPAYSLGEIENEVGYALMAFVTFFAWTRDEKRLRLACLAVLAGFAVISGSALLGGYLRHGAWPSDVYYGGVGGVSSYLVTVGPVLALTVAMFGRRHSSTWLVLLGLPFLAVTLLSAQRALWPAIGLQAALVCVWLWQVRAVAVGPLRLALTGLILLAVMGGGVYVSDRYRTGGNPESLVAMRNDLRPRVWKRVGAEILAHPLIGAGFGRGVMAKAYPALLPAADKGVWYPHNGVLLAESKVFWHPHNLVLNYGISAGVPGMVAVLALFAALAWRFWLLAVRGERLAGLSGLAGAAMVAGVLTRNMANDFFVRDGALLFWALAGMLFGYSLRRGSTHEGDPSGLRQARAGRCSAVPADTNTKDGIVVIGAGGHAKVVISTLTARGLVIGSVFEDDTKWGMDAQGARVGRIERERGGRGIIGIGDNAQRREMARALNFEWQTVVHPSACVHPSAKLGRGTVVFAGAVVQPDAVLGDHVIVNTGATVDHDCIVGDYAHLAPGVHLAGSVHVGEGSFLGIGSVVVPGVTIGRWSTLGAGAVAIRDLADGAVAVGVPAMTLKREEGGNSPA